ncbi:hypothetical protein AUJ84_04395 [Candidatus Pacearchaeota archaeon CG1_02_32_132]|nr:MAG: hypothetical protein AUJ84_04395 [Candidatus Pacearchaeota archaeon CG1_02_32_132]
MDIFNCSREKLAKILAENGELYSVGVRFFKGLRKQGVFDSGLEKSVDQALKTLNEANEIATNGAYYIFSVYDSWADRIDSFDEGFVVYQKIVDEMFERIGLSSEGASGSNRVTEILKKHEVSTLYTLVIPDGGYCGLNAEEDGGEIIGDDGEEEGRDVIRYSIVEEIDREYFKEKGIEIIVMLP